MGETATSREELVSTVILALATILTAWTSFQAAKWSGRQAIAFAQSAKARTLATQKETVAFTRFSFDVTLFVSWVNAAADERFRHPSTDEWQPDPKKLSGFLYARFPPHLRRATHAWLATQPLEVPGGPATPFQMPEYERPEEEQAAALHLEADQAATAGRENNLRADRYVATSVLIAAVLFFGAVGAKLKHSLLRRVTLVLSAFFLLVSGAVIASFPVALG